MESNVINLQDKIQKLIDQYTLATKKVEEVEEKNRQLAEENSQLIAQIQTSGKATGEQEKKYKTLQENIIPWKTGIKNCRKSLPV